MRFGLYLAESGQRQAGDPHAQLTAAGGQRAGARGDRHVERRRPQTILTDLRRLMAEHNIFRGQVISLEMSHFEPSAGPIRFHPRPQHGPRRRHPPGGSAGAGRAPGRRHREAPAAAGRRRPAPQARRAALRTARHRQDPHRPVPDQQPPRLHCRAADRPGHRLRRRGVRSGATAPARAGAARGLRPGRRGARPPSAGRNPLLFEVLDQMDGMAADADVAFVLTTNRPDLLEPALAQRPGRIDLAVEIELPNEMARAQAVRALRTGAVPPTTRSVRWSSTGPPGSRRRS